MKKRPTKKPPEGIGDRILESANQIIPGFQGLFKKLEKSGVFGARMGEIRKEIDRRFGGGKK